MRPPIEIPPGFALVRDKRTRQKFLATNLRQNSRTVEFDGQLIHEDCRGVRLYPAKPRRLTAGRAEIIARNDGGAR